MFLFYGSRKKLIDVADAGFYTCPNCNVTGTTTISVYSNYYHIFYIPVFPFDKETHAICSSCSSSRNDNRYGPQLTTLANDIKKNSRHPIYLYALVILFCLMITMIIIVAPKE